MQTVALEIEMNTGIDAAPTELEVHGLWAGYGARDVLEDYEMVISRGESVRLTGRNGSGKSTLLSCIEGSHKPRAGSILVSGISLMDRPVEAKRLIGMSNGTCPFPYLTGRENLDVARRVYDLAAEQVESFLGRFAA